MSSIETSSPPRFAASMSTNPATDAALGEVCAAVLEPLGGAPDLAVVFVSASHADQFVTIGREIIARTGARCVIGCTGESIVGNAQEVEASPAISLWGARLPGVTIAPMHLNFQQTAEGSVFSGWPTDLPPVWPAGAALLLLGEPFSFPADTLLERLNDDQPGIPVLGGMASAAHAPGQNCLWLNDQVHTQGAVAVLLHGNISIQSVVSQGCRPIGQTFVVTKAERNLIFELGGVPAMQRLQEVAESLAPEELQLINRGLHVGRVTSEYQENFARGDFLIRNVVGHDRENGALAVGDYIRVGQTVQFHVRDADTADEDLRALLAAAPAGDAAHSTGALLFTCNGRGTRLFDQPHHDASVVAEVLNAPPVAGFFAQGEIGPISGKNFLHGFTASLAVFSPLKSTT